MGRAAKRARDAANGRGKPLSDKTLKKRVSQLRVRNAAKAVAAGPARKPRRTAAVQGPLRPGQTRGKRGGVFSLTKRGVGAGVIARRTGISGKGGG